MVLVCEMAACIMVVKSLNHSNIFENIADFIKKWSIIIITLMDTDLKPDITYSYIKDMIRSFVDMSPTACHLYLLCDVLYSQVSKNI